MENIMPSIATATLTLLAISVILNVGLITGHIRIASPEKHQEMAYTDSQRALMQALVEDVQ